MKVEIIREAGYEEALLGMGLSYGLTSDMGIDNIYLCPEDEVVQKLESRAKNLAHKQGGHNTFLEQIELWIDITAPLLLWKQMDRYRLSSQQSSSTMHTIMKRLLTLNDFELPVNPSAVESLKIHVMNINEYIKQKDFESVIKLLPDSFLQRRIKKMSYKTLQNIYYQRHNHKLEEWRFFCEEILKQVEHPEFIDNNV